MTMIDSILNYLVGMISLIMDFFDKFVKWLSVPLGWIVSFLESIFYFFVKLVEVVIRVIDIFIAVFQFLGALAAGFFRTIYSMLVVDTSKTPVRFPSTSGQGIQAVIDNVLQPVGFLTVVPGILLAVIWLYWIVRIFSLLGGETNQDA